MGSLAPTATSSGSATGAAGQPGFGWVDPLFFDSSSFAHTVAQVVQSGAPHIALAYDFDLVDARRMHEECALHTNVVRDSTHGNILVWTVPGDLYYRSFKYLNSFSIPLHHLGVDANRISWSNV
jgi:hypothetical protein